MTQKSGKFTVKQVPLSKIIPYAKNPRTNDDAVDKVAASIREFGFQQPIVVDEKMIVIAGHTRLKAAQQLGLKTAPVHVAVGMSEEMARAYRIADNKTAEASGWDTALLTEELEFLLEDGIDLSLTGFDDKEIKDLFKVKKTKDKDQDMIPAVRPDTVSITGDIWQLGEHRLMCGDSCSRESVDLLLNGQKVDFCLTDPPYGLGDTKSEKNDYDVFEDTSENLDALIALWLPIARAVSPIVVFSCGVMNIWKYPRSEWILCWAYSAGAGSTCWGFPCWQPFLAYGKDPYLAAGKGKRTDTIEMNAATPHSKSKLDHPCPKPAKIWKWFIERLSPERGQSFLDPFAGSGTSFVVAEDLNRICYGMELDPRYTDVIIRRWQEFTEQAATLESGETFEKISSQRLPK